MQILSPLYSPTFAVEDAIDRELGHLVDAPQDLSILIDQSAFLDQALVTDGDENAWTFTRKVFSHGHGHSHALFWR